MYYDLHAFAPGYARSLSIDEIQYTQLKERICLKEVI